MASGVTEELKLDIFRKEAVRHHLDNKLQGEILMIPSGSARLMYRLLWVLVAGVILFISLGTVSRNAEGPALVRSNSRLAVRTESGGVVEAILVEPGSRVAQGQPLVRLRAGTEPTDVDKATQELRAAIVRMLANPADRSSAQSVPLLRAQVDLAQARLDALLVRAPSSGLVGDIRVIAGQDVSSGESIAALVSEPAKFSVVALLPGRYRPFLRVGQELRLEITGFKYSYQKVRIDGVGNEIIGPQEVRRVLGSSMADSVSVTQPVVVVQASFMNSSFTYRNQPLELFDGLQAVARVNLGSERLITTLLPSLWTVTR